MQATHFHELEDGRCRCDLCCRHCVIAPGEAGFCGVRALTDEGFVTLAVDRVVSAGVDPIEKKPLFHAHPGARIFSFAMAGCNLACPWCQNHTISQWPREHGLPFLPGERITPADLVARAVASGCRWIAATYTEPSVFFEYALEVARLARAAGLRNAWVTNGTIEKAPLAELIPLLDAANVDLKCYGDRAAEGILGIRSAHVGETIRALIDAGVSTEVTTCLVPGFNDAPDHLGKIVEFMASLGPAGIWHVSRYHPMYQWEAPPTELSSLAAAVTAGRAAGIPFIYVGNARIERGEDTACPSCDALLVSRCGYTVRACRVTPAGACPDCGAPIPGVWG
ncbi:MAG: AmmeMemoRadiSam system radical SAM enzyme [Deltaproteobacteria bacterium HGW-Deltaproteobacteria-17]|nr:MAG: AmmeMemoRadiSam system radical SAM enzyme [Deltaproteobacteria bacterium HGW-Deltaproteobacteria-17]